MHLEVGENDVLEIPDHVIDNVRRAHGTGVDAWLAMLGPHLHTLLRELDARIVPGTPALSYHLVFFAATPEGTGLAIKCTLPNEEQVAEVAGVEALSRSGIGPRLRMARLDLGIIVVERIQPGTILPTHVPTLDEDAHTTREVASLAAKMAATVDVKPFQKQLVDVRTYTRALDQVDASSSLWAVHQKDVSQARDIRERLLHAADRTDVFLHGDLQHYNVLSDTESSLRVIDPKGLIGPAGYDFGAYTYNPMGIHNHPDFTAITRQRVDLWSGITGISWETVRSWGFVAAMLSASWSAENGNNGWQPAIKVAQTLRDLER